MAVSANSNFQLNRNDLIRRAYQICGLLNAAATPKSEQITMASDFLNLELDNLQARGVVLRSVSIATLSLTNGTASYTLPSTVLDVLPSATVKATTSTDTETPVESVGLDRYLTITDKTTSGVPSLMYLERGPSFIVKVWPVPSAAMTLQYKKVAFLADSDSAAVDTDLGRHWHKGLMYGLAAMLAESHDQAPTKVRSFSDKAEYFYKLSLNHEQEHGPAQFRPMAGYGYRRR